MNIAGFGGGEFFRRLAVRMAQHIDVHCQVT
jgi:hypothetical protein